MRTIVAIGLCAWGCGGLPHYVTTELVFHDPEQVAITLDGSGSGAAEGRADLGGGASAEYAVHVVRDVDLGIAVDWDTKLALATGERATIVSPHEPITLAAKGTDVVSFAQLDAPTLVLHWCTTLGSHRAYRATSGSYDIDPRGCTLGPSTASVVAVPYTLATPWSNVRIVEHDRPDHTGAELILFAGTISFGSFAALMFTIPAHDFEGGATTKYLLAGVCLAALLGFDLPMIPTLLASDRDTVYAPR